MKKILSAVLLLALLCALAVPGTAHDRKGHDSILERVLFGRENYGVVLSEEGQRALKALEYASYLALDQFNGNGTSELEYLNRTYKVSGIPKTIEDFDFADNWHHRSYTHRGWDYVYPEDRAHWVVRKNILLAATEKVFDFSLMSGNIFGHQMGYDARCESFAALVYDLHIIGDQEERKNGKASELMLPLARANANRSNPDIFLELDRHLSGLFEEQRETYTYGSMMRELDALAHEARTLAASTGGIDNDEKFAQFQLQVEDLLVILENYVPKLLQREEFFTDVFQ